MIRLGPRLGYCYTAYFHGEQAGRRLKGGRKAIQSLPATVASRVESGRQAGRQAGASVRTSNPREGQGQGHDREPLAAKGEEQSLF